MTEETQKQPLDPEREALIAEMLRDAQKTEIPSELTRNPVIHKGDETLPAPMVVNKIDSAGYVFIWDTRNYQKAPVLYYMLQQKLRERRKDGSYRWTSTDPGKEPRRGTFKCMLHKDETNRVHYDALGFHVCPKDNLANPYEVRRHMQLKHKAEWGAIEEERKQTERNEDRALQRMLLSSQMGRGSVEQVKEQPKEQPKEDKPKKAPFICDVCGSDFGAEKTLSDHIKTQHK